MMSYATETQRLREERDALWAEIRRRDMEKVRSDIAALEQQRLDEERERAEEAALAASENLERIRRAEWQSYSLDQALAKGDEAFRAYLTGDLARHIPADKSKWPPGSGGPSAFAPVAAIEDARVDASETALGRMQFPAARRAGP
jgi:hypothetical protein